MAGSLRIATGIVAAALLLSCNAEPPSSVSPPPPPPGPPPPPPPGVSITGVWDFQETVRSCVNVGAYRFVQTEYGTFYGWFGQAGNGCSTTPNDFRGNVTGGVVSGTHITFQITALYAGPCDYAGDVSGNPPSTISGTFACGANTGTWSARLGAPVTSITLDPPGGGVVVGWNITIKARLRSATGAKLFERTVTWASDDHAVATVVSSGDQSLATVEPTALVSGVTAGPVGITATADAAHATANLEARPITSLPLTIEAADHVEVMAADGSARTWLTRAGILEPAWSPDGATLAFSAVSLEPTAWWTQCDIVTAPAGDGSKAAALTTQTGCNHSPAWSRDGSKIAFARGDPACWSDCRVAIWVMNANGSDQVKLAGTGSGWDTRPAWSPDGTKIAFESYDSTSDRYDIYVMNADGTGAINLTNDPGFNTDPAWSSDGTLAFVRDGDIWTMNGDGSGATNLTANLAFESNPAWSLDGTQLLFISSPTSSCAYPDPPCRHTGADLYVMNRDGSNVRRLTATAADEANPALQPRRVTP